MKFYFFKVLLFAIILSSCQSKSEKKDLPTIYANYYLRYLEDEGFLKVEASFYEGDSLNKTPIEFEKEVTFNDKVLAKKNIAGKSIRYQFENLVPYEEAYSFKHFAKDNSEVSTAIKMDKISDFQVEYCDTKRGIRFSIGQTNLKENETIVLLIGDSENKTSSIEINGPISGNVIDIPAEKFKQLPSKGPATIYVVKKQNDIQQEGNYEITSTIEYYSKSQQITIDS